jgi:hypothetical protein
MGVSPLHGILPRAEIYYFKINSETELSSGTLLKELRKLRSLKMMQDDVERICSLHEEVN